MDLFESGAIDANQAIEALLPMACAFDGAESYDVTGAVMATGDSRLAPVLDAATQTGNPDDWWVEKAREGAAELRKSEPKPQSLTEAAYDDSKAPIYGT